MWGPVWTKQAPSIIFGTYNKYEWVWIREGLPNPSIWKRRGCGEDFGILLHRACDDWSEEEATHGLNDVRPD